MSSPITVLLVDDHPVVRQGLKALIDHNHMFLVIGEASNGEDALRQITELKPDVVVLDIDMPKMNGLSVARAVKAQMLETQIIFMTFHADEDLMRSAMDVGGKGYLLKGSEMEEVAAAINAVYAGRTYVGSTMTDILLDQTSAPSGEVFSTDLRSLTAGERKILRLIADGKSSKEIGDDLSIHYRTVENHRTNICRKLRLEGTNALARFALQNRTALHEQLH